MQALVDKVVIPDALLIADYHKGYQPETEDFNDRTKIGEGVGNLLTFAELGMGVAGRLADSLLPQGAILDRDLSKIHTVDPRASDEILEYISHSWYDGTRGDASDQAGPMEMALVGHRVHNREQSIELLGTIHTFDPRVACAVHLTDCSQKSRVDIELNTR